MGNQQLVLFGAIFLFALISFLVVLVVKQQQRIRIYTQPRRGFLGKPLAAALMTVIIAGSAVGGVAFLQQQQDLNSIAKADLDIKVTINKQIVVNNGNSVVYQFSASPMLDGQPFGTDETAQWNLFWNFNPKGSTQPLKAKSEIGLGKHSASLVQVELPKGDYTVYLTVDYSGTQNKIFTITEDFSV